MPAFAHPFAKKPMPALPIARYLSNGQMPACPLPDFYQTGKIPIARCPKMRNLLEKSSRKGDDIPSKFEKNHLKKHLKLPACLQQIQCPLMLFPLLDNYQKGYARLPVVLPDFYQMGKCPLPVGNTNFVLALGFLFATRLQNFCPHFGISIFPIVICGDCVIGKRKFF